MDHFIGHDHEHTHGSGHEHHHDHHHGGGMSEYYVDQLLSIFISAAFGVTGVMMYERDMLQHILVTMFHIPVLVGSIGLIALAVFRGVCLWKSIGQAEAHHHHSHDHDHSHDHAHQHNGTENCCDDHEHGNAYWRVVVLAFPIVIFLIGLPNGALSKDWIIKRMGTEQALGVDLSNTKAKNMYAAEYDFSSLSMAALSEERRKELEATTATVRGQIKRIDGSQREFGLFYFKSTCCRADVVPLNARILCTSASVADSISTHFISDEKRDFEWVQVKGILRFAEQKPGVFITVLVVQDPNDVTSCEPVRE